MRKLLVLVGLAVAAVAFSWPRAELLAQTFEWISPEPVTSNPGVANPPTVARGGLHGVDIIYTGTDRHMYHQFSSGGPLNKPQDIGFVGTSMQASVVANGRHKLDVFYRGDDQKLWTRWVENDGTWSAGVSLGGDRIRSSPFAVSNGLHKLDVFYAGSDGSLYLTWWDGGAWFSGAEHLSAEPLMRSGPVQSLPPSQQIRRAPVAVVNGPHLVDVLYVIEAPNRNYGKLRTVWSNGKGSSLIGDWSVPMDLNQPYAAPPPGVAFVASTLGAAAGLVIDGSWRSHVFFTDAVTGPAHIGRLKDLTATKGQPWSLNDANIFGGVAVSAGSVNQVFMINSGLGDPNHPPGLVTSCYLRSPASADERAVNCFQFPVQ